MYFRKIRVAEIDEMSSRERQRWITMGDFSGNNIIEKEGSCANMTKAISVDHKLFDVISFPPTLAEKNPHYNISKG